MGRARKPNPSYLRHRQSGKGRVVVYDESGQRRQILLPGEFSSKDARSTGMWIGLSGCSGGVVRRRSSWPTADNLVNILAVASLKAGRSVARETFYRRQLEPAPTESA
jgi:hypothetical protein